MYQLILADDEPRVRRGLRDCIPWSELGFTVEGEASNGKEALELTLKIRPHLVITDIRMPDMDGLQFIEAIRNLGIHSLIILISGFSDFEYARRAIRYGVTDYLLKPIEEEELYDRILLCIKRLDMAENVRAERMTLPSGQTEANNLIVQETLHFIEAQYNRNISLSAIAQKVAVHPNYLSTLFTRSVGEPFSRYLAHFRVEQSKKLLHNPQLKIYEVAEMVGYSDYRWYSKLFKQFEAITPAEYRANSGTRIDTFPDD